jgi:hypothetical protein
LKVFKREAVSKLQLWGRQALFVRLLKIWRKNRVFAGFWGRPSKLVHGGKEMKKYFLGVCLVLAVFFGYTTCLNPINFDEGQLPTIKVTGSLDTNDVTAASTYIVNLSKSFSFTDVTITQKENPALAEIDYFVSQFPNTKDSQGNWKTVKARYIQASDIEYEVSLKIINGNTPEPSFSKSADLLATQSKGIYYVWMYRTEDPDYIADQIAGGVPEEFADVVIISPQDPNLPPFLPLPSDDDTQDIEINVGSNNEAIVAALQKISNALVNAFITTGPSADDENGSVPPFISEHNRKEMGTFIVVNLSKSRNIDSVVFKQETGVETYSNVYSIISPTTTIPAVRTQDRNAIALKNGTYAVTAAHGGTNLTVAKRVVLVPSNDPQTVREHYIYFYKAKNGEYDLSVEKPDDNDIDLNDVLPPSAGYGVGRVRIINRTANGLVDSISITSKAFPGRGSAVKIFSDFVPPQPIGNGFGEVDFIGTSAFPIDGYFFANVNLLTAEDIVTVRKLIYLNNSIAQIIIEPDEAAPNKIPGSRITVTNATTTTSVINKIEIFNVAQPAEHADLTLSVANGGAPYSFNVVNTPGMPIMETYSYKAKLTVTVTKQLSGTYTIDGSPVVDPVITNTGIITKNFSPDNSLYGINGPGSHERFINLGESDIASIIPTTPPVVPAFVPVSDVLILNGEGESNGGIKFFAKDGAERQLSWDVIPGTATYKTGHWTLGEADPNLVIAELLGTTPPYALSEDGKLKVNSNWSYDYLYVAFIIPNGKAKGTRHPMINQLGAMQYLLFDEDKDFVKVFKLVKK